MNLPDAMNIYIRWIPSDHSIDNLYDFSLVLKRKIHCDTSCISINKKFHPMWYLYISSWNEPVYCPGYLLVWLYIHPLVWYKSSYPLCNIHFHSSIRIVPNISSRNPSVRKPPGMMNRENGKISCEGIIMEILTHVLIQHL